MNDLPLAITMGEPAGIGPDIIIKSAQHSHPANWMVIADISVLLERAKQLGVVIKIVEFDDVPKGYTRKPNEIIVSNIQCQANVKPGVLDRRNSGTVIDSVKLAVQGCLNGSFSAVVTTPINKSIINDARIYFTGHTEFIAKLTNTNRMVMMLLNEHMKVALLTTHLPLRNIPKVINQQLLKEVIEVIYKSMQKDFAVKHPRIGVCGLNPHAGENGYLGSEEQEFIIPVIHFMQQKGYQVSGPFPADTIFTKHILEQLDVVLAMYHDQGLPVLKYSGFNQAVNITLGLPIVRTSVDHGTALHLAATGKAQETSLIAAIRLAEMVASNRNT